MSFASDIPLSVAVAAHSGTSWTPERRGPMEQAEYREHLEEVHEILRQHAEKGGVPGRLIEEFARYRAGYRKRTLAYLASRSRCVSSFIAGPSNFPVARMEKRSNISHRRLEELMAFREYALRAAIRNLRPDLRPIMAGDADALERLAKKIAAAEVLQQKMTLANRVVRAFYKAGVRDSSAGEQWQRYLEKLVEVFPTISEARALELLRPDFCGRIAYPDYELKNNGANIRRMKQRLEQIGRAQATPDSAVEGANGVKCEDCPAENRVRLTFPGKPSVEIRTKLKKNGFRWAPSLGVWQAYRNSGTLSLAHDLTSTY